MKLSEKIQDIIKETKDKDVCHYLHIAFLLQKDKEESPE